MKNLFYIVFVFLSCSRVLEIDNPGIEPRLVLNLIVKPDGNNLLYITRNFQANKADTLSLVKNARVIIETNNQALAIFEEDSIGRYFLPTGFIQPGNGYKISAYSEGFPIAYASVVIPTKTPIRITDTSWLSGAFSEEKILELSLEFEDDISPGDFYMLEIFSVDSRFESIFNPGGGFSHVDTTRFITPLLINATDNLIDLVYEGELSFKFFRDKIAFEAPTFYPKAILFSDKFINGKSKELIVSVPIVGFSKNQYVQVLFSSIGQEYYNFAISMASYQKNKKGIFSEPLRLYSNVNDGLGYILAKSTYIDSVFLKF